MNEPLNDGLGGRHVLVTRPFGQAEVLVQGIERLGGRVTHIPFLEINSVPDLTALELIACRLSTYKTVVFISANAVRLSWPCLVRSDIWPENLPAAVVGPGTARSLYQKGVKTILIPERDFDSEGLLALPFFNAEECRGQRIALIRGMGGRDLLANVLRERGASVDEASVYERKIATNAPAAMDHLLANDLPQIILITSSESLEKMMLVLPEIMKQRIRDIEMIVPHRKIFETAQRLGFSRVKISAGGDDGILELLKTYN